MIVGVGEDGKVVICIIIFMVVRVKIVVCCDEGGEVWWGFVLVVDIISMRICEVEEVCEGVGCYFFDDC